MTAKVASIYFAPLIADRSIYGGMYELPPVPLDSDPAILMIYDRMQYEDGPYQFGQRGMRQKRKYPVFGEIIARDIVNEWTTGAANMNPQCRPGVWVVRERIPLLNQDGSSQVDAEGMALWREAAQEEKDAMWREDLAAAKTADQAYARLLFLRASADAQNPLKIPLIPKTARLAAWQYGLTAEWLRENAAVDVQQCRFCTKVISAKAIKCPHCTEIVNPEAYAEQEVIRKAALNAAVANLKLLQQRASPSPQPQA